MTGKSNNSKRRLKELRKERRKQKLEIERKDFAAEREITYFDNFIAEEAHSTVNHFEASRQPPMQQDDEAANLARKIKGLENESKRKVGDKERELIYALADPKHSFHIWTKLNNSKTASLMLLDTGANICLMPKQVYDDVEPSKRTPLRTSDRTISAGNGSRVRVHGMAEVKFEAGGQIFRQLFYVVEDTVRAILGLDFLTKHDAHIMVGRRAIVLDGKEIKLSDQTNERISDKVTASKTIHIKPGEEVIIQGLVKDRSASAGEVVILEPVRSLVQWTGALVCRLVVTNNNGRVPVRIYNPHDSMITVYRNTTLAMLNRVGIMTDWERTGGENSGVDDEKSHERVNDLRGEKVKLPVDIEDNDQFNREVSEHLKKLYEDSVAKLAYRHKEMVKRLFNEYEDIFAKNSADYGQTDICKHEIDTGEERPVRQRARRLVRAHVPEVQKQINDYYEQGVISPSDSEWASNILLVKKKTGEFRMCIDYRELNAKTKKLDQYALPRIDDTLDALGRAKYFCTLDLINGYHQVELTDSAKEKTAFIAPHCNPTLWEFNYMPFGLVGAPRTFQRMMDKLLRGLEYGIALAYLDDIIVYSETIEGCIDNLRVVFDRIRHANLKLKPKKCTFFQPETTFLGHVISGDGVKCDPVKVEAIAKWHPPKTTKQVKSFLGIIGYYRKFINNYSEMAEPLQDLMKKAIKFKWGVEQEESFNLLKQSLITAPVLAYPQNTGMYICDTDASAYAISGILSQMQQDDEGIEQERPIAYSSRKLSDTEKKYCARRRELLAIVTYVKHYDTYLRGPRFVIRTDHASLKYVKTIKDLPDQFARWVMSLEKYNYEIVIRKGTLHVNADVLSRYICEGKRCICDGVSGLEDAGDVRDTNNPDLEDKPEEDVTFNAFHMKALWSDEEMGRAQGKDPDIALIYNAKQAGLPRPTIGELAGTSQALRALCADWKRLFLHRDMLYRHYESHSGNETLHQLVVPYRFQRTLCHHFHNTAGAHLGKSRTCYMMQRRMYWYRMHECVRTWILCCDVCQRKKRPGKTPKAPMKLYPSGYPNERITMDVCGPLAMSVRGNLLLLVITDSFTKFTKAFPIRQQTAVIVAEILDSRWIDEYGEPEQLHTDQGRNFESKLMAELCQIRNIEKTRTTPYHPSSDGQVERFNATVMTMINSLSSNFVDWDLKISKAVAAYNQTVHAATGFTPNRLWFGRECYVTVDSILPLNPGRVTETRERYISRLDDDTHAAQEAARLAIGRAMKSAKKYHDRTAHYNNYKEGDMVMKRDKRGKVQGTKKLSDKWIGPYFIIDCMESVFRIAENSQSTKKSMRVIHHDNLKPYWMCVEDKPDNSWVFSISKTYKSVAVEQGCQTDPTPLIVEPQEPDVEEEQETRVEDQTEEETVLVPVQQLKRKRGRPRKESYGLAQPVIQTVKKRRTESPLCVRRSGRLRTNIKRYGV